MDLLDEGIDVHVYAREHGPTVSLLEHYDLPHSVLASEGTSTTRLVTGHALYEARLLTAARRRNASVLASIGGLSTTHLAPLAGARSVAFVDWQPGRVDGTAIRLANAVPAPLFLDENGPGLPAPRGRRIRYEGFHELSYLHPDRFDPDRDVLSDLGLDPEQPLFVTGFTNPERRAGLNRPIGTAVNGALSKHGTILGVHEDTTTSSTAEDAPPPTFSEDTRTNPRTSSKPRLRSNSQAHPISQLHSRSHSTSESVGTSSISLSAGRSTNEESANQQSTNQQSANQQSANERSNIQWGTIPPSARPHVIAHATLCVGDSMTLAAEAALLGTPAIHLPTGTPTARCAGLRRRELLTVATDGKHTFDLTESFVASGSFVNGSTDQEQLLERRDRYLEDAVDVAGFAADILRREARRGSS